MIQKTWILSDGKAGHRNQSIGVAEALGVEYQVIELRKRRFGGFLSLFHPLLKVEDFPKPPYPSMIISTGNLTSGLARYVKRHSPSTFTVQMMTPLNRFGLKTDVFQPDFDVIAAPAHEQVPVYPNIVVTTGAPNRITEDRLIAEKETWAEALSGLKGRKVAVLIGGQSKRFDFSEDDAQKLAEDLLALQKEHELSLMVTTSRRTGRVQTEILQNLLSSSPDIVFYTPEMDAQNPYFGFVAWADAFVVTAESTSMVSEACSTGKPVYLVGLDNDLQSESMGKFNVFYDALKQQGRVAPLTDFGALKPVDPLDDTALVAAFIKGKTL